MPVKTFGSIHFDKESDQWVIDQLEPHVCIRLKNVFQTVDESSVAPFYFTNKLDTCADLYWFIQRYALTISEEDLKRLKKIDKKYYEEQNELNRIILPSTHFQPMELANNEKAREYQVKAHELNYLRKRLLIADDIGLGKTLTGALMLTKGVGPALFVCQTHLPKQWQDEIRRFFGIEAHIIKTKKLYSLPEAKAYIISYSKLSGWVDIFDKGFFKYVCFDEIQELRIQGSEKYRAAHILSKNADYTAGLSATPIYNYGGEIFSVLDLLHPGCLGKEHEFIREWCKARFYYKNKIKVSDPEALGTYLRENFLMIRRSRHDVGKELPPINRLVYTVEHDEAIAHDAEKLARQLAIKVTNGTFVERGQAARDLDVFVRHQTGISKAKAVAEFVRILLENNEPVLLAGWHRDVYSVWLDELAEYNPVMYTGSESPKQKEEAKQKFISGESNLMIISLRSGIGLDGLQKRCKTVVIGELDWSPKVHDQLIGRVDREGQAEEVTAIFLISDFGSDPVIVDLLALKASQSHNIMNPLQAVEQTISDESRIKLLAESFLNKRLYVDEAGNITDKKPENES